MDVDRYTFQEIFLGISKNNFYRQIHITTVRGTLYIICMIFLTFYHCWPGLGLPRPKAIVVIPKINSCQNHLRKKTSKSAKSPGHYATKIRSVEITMHLGLDNMIKLKFTTNFDTCAIFIVPNCLKF